MRAWDGFASIPGPQRRRIRGTLVLGKTSHKIGVTCRWALSWRSKNFRETAGHLQPGRLRALDVEFHIKLVRIQSAALR